MIEFLADAGNDEYRCISPETALFSESTNSFGLSDEDEGYSLAETGTWIVLSQV